jgi:glycosyltransferase involved in cell wall biosynthesis
MTRSGTSGSARKEHRSCGAMSPDGQPARPRLAVLIPVFNGQDALERSLARLCDDDEPLDVFIVDDGSEPPVEIPPDLPFTVRLIRLPTNGGVTKALNAGLVQVMAAGYEYIARLDAGDLSLPGRFAAQMAFLDAHPDHAVVGAHAEYVDDDGAHLFTFRPPTDHAALATYFKVRNGFEHPTVMIRGPCLELFGWYDARYCGAEDYELWRRLGRTYKLANLPMVVLRKETTISQITARRFRSATRLRVQLRYFEPWSIGAYLGILRTVLALLTSRRLALRLKHWHERLRRAPDDDPSVRSSW